MSDGFFPIWPNEACEATGGFFNRVVCILILLHESHARKTKALSDSIFFKLSVSFDVCPATRGVF
jgi:hypothetical protein